MSGGGKAKAGLLATGGLLAALTGFVDDCGRIGARTMNVADDVAMVGVHGDDFARLGARSAGGAGSSVDDFARLGVAAGTRGSVDDFARLGTRIGGVGDVGESRALSALSWEDLDVVELGADTVGYGFDAADLMLDEERDELVPDVGDPALEARMAALLELPVENAAVAAMLPLHDRASDEERSLRERMLSAGVSLLDTPTSLASLLEHQPRPLLVVARRGPTDGTMLAPDGSVVAIGDLMDRCRAARADCAVLACDDSTVTCAISAAMIADAAIDADSSGLRGLYDELLRRRDDGGDRTRGLVLYRIATTRGVTRVVKSRAPSPR